VVFGVVAPACKPLCSNRVPRFTCAGDCRIAVADCGVMDTQRMMLCVRGRDGEAFEVRFPVHLPWTSGW
jgi:hypothetical protein